MASKDGAQRCLEICFPEVSRNLAARTAELNVAEAFRTAWARIMYVSEEEAHGGV